MYKILVLVFIGICWQAGATDTCKVNLKADFSLQDACSGNDIQLQNLSTINYSDANLWWDFGDATGSFDVAPSKLYDTKTIVTYTLKLKLWSNNGCKDSIMKTVTIYPNPEFNILRKTEQVNSESFLIFNTDYSGALKINWTLPNGDHVLKNNASDTIRVNTKINAISNWVYAIGTDNRGCYTKDSMLFKGGMFVNKIQNTNADLIFQNPAKCELIIQNKGIAAHYNLYNFEGQLINAGVLLNGINAISSLTPGTYFLQSIDVQGVLFVTKLLVE